MAEAAATEASGASEKMVLVVGIDDSVHSFYALQWTLSHFFSGASAAAVGAAHKLIIVHAKPSPSSVIGLGGPGAAEAIPYVESDLKRIAASVVEKARELCVGSSVTDVAFEVVDGDARNVLCDAVEKFHADILAVGSHGYGAIKRAVLGSVSDYCAHHAHCSVLIVKKPKHKN
ncbi:Universal stress protein A-like protein [Apostasia shenzhenica]|uniref:Universal stress protein A-like protein n=1 Tax=Apostasia shenzhenica TaxID=1088818 RepID=A0A2I0A070_9ASPA|nr:Universal stress protein A-like protein [Apostasia shenzhenica]